MIYVNYVVPVPQVAAIDLVEARLYCDNICLIIPQNTANMKIEINEVNANTFS